MLLVDKYAYTNRLRDFNPMAKFLFAIGALFIAVGLNNLHINLIIFLMMFIFTTVIAKIPIKNYLKLYYAPLAFLLISIITIVISKSTNREAFLYSIRIGKNYFGINENSLRESIFIVFRVLSCISSMFFLALTTSINQLIKVFKKLKFPPVMVELIVLIYRFIFIFLEESKEIYNAQEMKYGYVGMKNSYRSISLLVKCLFIRVFQKYRDMVISLDSKLYNGEFKVG